MDLHLYMYRDIILNSKDKLLVRYGFDGSDAVDSLFLTIGPIPNP